MKTLEENRYKKTYQSDCRRVAWLVNNNLSEDYESMPVSMKKKWSKAAYGRERQLATEFIKSKENEAKLRESIRSIIKSVLTEGKLTEGISVADTRFVGKFVIHILSSGNEMRSAILSKKNNSKYGTRDKKDLKTLWDLAGKYKGKEIKEGKLTEVSSEISISLDDFDKVRKLLKPKTNQIVKHPFSKKTFGLKVDKKKYDKTLEILMKKRIDVRG